MTCFASIKLILVQIHLKYWYCNTLSLQVPLFPRRLCLNAPWPTETLLNTILIMFLIGFPIFLLPHSTTYRNYWIYQTIYQANSVKCIIKLYTNHNTLLVKRATYQKSESVRVASLSKINSGSTSTQSSVQSVLNFSQNGRRSFIFTTHFCMKSALKFSPKTRSLISSILHLSIPHLLVHKIALTIRTNTSFLYISAIFHLPI